MKAMNHYSVGRYLLLVVMVILALVYAAPNLYGQDPAVQISNKGATALPAALISQVKTTLNNDSITYLRITHEKNDLWVRFKDTTEQLKAQDALKTTLGSQYIVAVSLASRTPAWLEAIGAHPMKLGLDLQGGINFLLQVDVNQLLKARESSDVHAMGVALRAAQVRYASISARAKRGIQLRFRDASTRNQALSALASNYPTYTFSKQQKAGSYYLTATMSPAELNKVRMYAITQNITTLKKRVDELGVAEASVTQQGANFISVDLPGVQDPARAKSMLGKFATVRFQLVDTNHDVQAAVNGVVPFGSSLYKDEQGNPILLKNQVILHGDSIVGASTSAGQDGRPAVNIQLGSGITDFARITAQNIGKPLASVYVEKHLVKKVINGKTVTVPKETERVISVATIQSALGARFQITGLDSQRYANNLALLLRSGALSAPMSIVQNQLVGPSLGKSNIQKGVMSTAMGSLLVILFMAIYYRVFGLVADMALILNIVFIVAILSIMGATLTLPGIAGIVLTVGMAVDANVLINERIREELRNGISPQAAIHVGYERAFATIVDANVTTLIVAVVLVALGAGSVKAFAVTLIVGLLTSMITAIFFTRAVINLTYGRRVVKRLSIGIKVR